ncbi:MAG: hypothetical protein ACHQD8_06740 [Chitinophagales bacterium]
MSLKTCLLAITLLFSIAAYPQDKIYKKDGDAINAKVKTIGSNTITYKRFDNQDGPEYTILKKEVTKIVYQNGTTDSFEGTDTKETAKGAGKTGHNVGKTSKKYGDNIFSIIPGAYSADLDGTINDPGIGICYERQLDEQGHISVNLPVVVNFLSDRDFNNYYYNSGYNGSAKGYTSVSFMPGIKFYPTKSNNAVRYSIGASFFTVFGKEPFYVYSSNAGSSADYHYAIYGLMISNSINVSATKHFYLSMDLNAGIPLSDNRHADVAGIDVIINQMLQFLVKVGYRF